MSSTTAPNRKILTPRPLLASVLVATVTALAAASHASEPARPTAKFETPNYVAEITATGPYKVGVAGTAKVTLLAKGGYHINPQYPYRFKTAEPPKGLSYPKPVLERVDGQFEEKRAVFSLAFVATETGQFDVGGALHMSVCSANNCLVDKPALAVSVKVQ
jgi:hypothetical protein